MNVIWQCNYTQKEGGAITSIFSLVPGVFSSRLCVVVLLYGNVGRADETMKPEEHACQIIDALLAQTGWVVQDYDRLNVRASCGVAVRGVSWLGKYIRLSYFAIFSVDSFHTLVKGRLPLDSMCSSVPPGCSSIVYSHERF